MRGDAERERVHMALLPAGLQGCSVVSVAPHVIDDTEA